MVEVDGVSFLVIVGVAFVAAVVSSLLAGRLPLPVVVLELLLGIIVGPDVLDLAQPDDFIEFFSSLGLGLLFFFAGYEIDLDRIRGIPLRLAVLGWLISLALAYAIGGILAASGVIISLLFVGTAMSTTAIGTLIPILNDAGEMKTRFGTYLLAAGAVGEFGPILLITLLFSGENPSTAALFLTAFVVAAVVVSVFATRGVVRGWGALERTLETSGQIAVRGSVFVVFALAALASELGLDLLLGGFVAGIIVRLALKGREVPIFESKLTAVGYGFLIPFFFVTSGLKFDLDSLLSDPVNLLKVLMFLGLFLVIRGAPAMLLYVKELDLRDRAALAFFSATQLPLVVAITTIATEEHSMRASTAASLVGAAIVSTMVFPLVGLHLRGDRASAMAAEPGWEAEPA
ncbi:MAG: cation:proton antiporter [Solirubrobacteraceae bacterium]|nr:cation:proton antiporter [Solirubrobacteraceae bacterium]